MDKPTLDWLHRLQRSLIGHNPVKERLSKVTQKWPTVQKNGVLEKFRLALAGHREKFTLRFKMPNCRGPST